MSDDKKEAQVVYLKLDDIIPNRFQPREVFDEGALEELSESIKEHGVIQPVIVRPKDGKYELIAGERRCKASALAGLTSVPAIVREMDDKESAKISLLENLQRKNLSAIEEARTYKKILELDNMSQEQLAKTMGKSQPMIANKIRLLALPEEVQDALIKNQISERHARSLLTIKDKETQLMMLERIKNERLTVRELDAEIKKLGTNKESGDNTMPYNMDNNPNMMNNMNNMPPQFSGVSNNYGNFNNMGLNDYQGGNSGMFNNIPNFNNNTPQDVTPLMNNNFSNEVPNPMNNFEEPKVDNTDYSDFNDNKDFSIPNMPNDMPNNSYSSLGSMFDGGNGNNNNMNPNMQENNSNPFISQIREDTIKPKENQFLPNFNTPNNFNNQSNNMNDFGMNSFLNSNSFNNNFESNINNNFNNNNDFNNNFNNNFVPNNNNLNNNFMPNNNDFNNNFIPNNDFNNNFSNPNSNLNMPSNNFQSNQGGLFNQPLNIVNVPNQNNYQEDNVQENQDKNLDFEDKKETFDNPFDDAYEDILNAKPVSVNPEEETSKEESEEDNTKDEIENKETNELEEEKKLDDDETKENEKDDNIEKENDDTSSEEVEVIGEESNEETPKEESKKEDNYIRLEPEKTIFDARGAVYELKKTTDAIKQNNISIDTEEIEFDDYYQVIIKIKK